jgi:methionyl-tRNA formyltransferase
MVATGLGALQILELQPAGKRMLTAAEFLRGYPVKAGERFGRAEG